MQDKPKTGYMKWSPLFPFLILILFISSCTNYGKKYAFDSDHNIYYKGEGVSETDAKNLATFFNKQGYYHSGQKADVQIKKTKDTFNINFIVDKAKVTPDLETNFILFGGYISKEVFSNAPVTILLSDPNFNEIKNLGYARPPVVESAPAR